MIEKILNIDKLSLEEIKKLLTARNFQKLYRDLGKIGFFAEEKETSNYKKIYTILKTEPSFPHQESGEYIHEELFKNGKVVSSKVYNFYLKESERDILK